MEFGYFWRVMLGVCTIGGYLLVAFIISSSHVRLLIRVDLASGNVLALKSIFAISEYFAKYERTLFPITLL